jgi:hypothetical protein
VNSRAAPEFGRSERRRQPAPRSQTGLLRDENLFCDLNHPANPQVSLELALISRLLVFESEKIVKKSAKSEDPPLFDLPKDRAFQREFDAELSRMQFFLPDVKC